MSAVLNAALAYAARGWPVFPCEAAQKPHPKSKAPLTENGLKDASTDPDTIRGWWKRWPQALIGLPTGAPLGAFVVDLDPRTSTCEQLLKALSDHVGASMGDPVVAVTQSGGWHLYFALPDGVDAEGVRNRAGRKSGLVANVDVRGTGGYVIAPPSVMSDGKAYTWRGRADGERGLTDAPSALIDAILRRGAFARDQQDETRRRSQQPTADERARKYAYAAFDAELQALRGAPDGTRNHSLNEAAFKLGQLVGSGALSEYVVLAALEEVASQWPNLKKSRGTIKSGLSAGMAQPRDLSELSRSSSSPRPTQSNSAGSQTLANGSKGDGDGLSLAERCAGLDQNDTGNAHRLLARYSDDILHIRDVGWSVWDGKRWSIEGGSEAVSRMAQDTAQAIKSECDLVPVPEDGDPDKARAQRWRFAVSSGNVTRITAMMAVAATHATVAARDMDAEPMAMNVQNGTLRVEMVPDPECPDPDATRRVPAATLSPHRPADRISRIMTAAYDPEATAPRWDAFVKRFLPDPEVRWWVQRWQGYAMTGLTGAQLLCFNHGLGANGKTTFTEAVRRIMGDYAATLPAEAVTGDQTRRSDQAVPEFARLTGVRLVLIGELPRGQPLKEETIKLLTGEEPMLVRHLNREFFDLLPQFKAVMTGNHKPNATGSDYAIWRRLRLVPWTERLSEEERRPMAEVIGEFVEEAPGVLNWLLAGLFGYLTEGLGAPPAILDATEEYRSEVDPVGEFLKACTVKERGPEVEARRMFEHYILWCEANAVRPLKETSFAKEMAQKGMKKTKSRIRKYQDVKLLPLPAQEQYSG